MCGFVGILTPRSAVRLFHRGPDAAGAIVETLPWANVSLEMTRLAIVDQHALKVPFDFRASTGIVLAFNGEIYGWRELRAALSDGTPWETDCDAEVVARAWRRWGTSMLHHLNGMFGLCLVDERTNTVFLARDRAGEKPLYYAALGSGLAFASEIKALPLRLEEAPCAELEALEFDCLETTPFAGVRCLGPGEAMHFHGVEDLREPKSYRWWMLPSAPDETMTFNDAVNETEALVVDAVRIRAVAEVPAAVQLSGGLDSAIIQAIVSSERLYTVDFPDDGVDNMRQAVLAAQGTATPNLVTFGLRDLETFLPMIAYHLDTPATWTAVCQWFLDGAIARDGSVVVFSGEGADELFGGYSRYRFLWWLEHMVRDPNLLTYGPMYLALFGDAVDVMARMLNRGGPATLAHARALVERFAGDGDLCRRMARVDFYTTMQCLLRMADRMAAAHSLENRSPFLDYRLMELAGRMPTRWKINEQESKVVLRAVARRLGVAEAIVDEKGKRGLFLPWMAWRGASGERGAWDRGSFAREMREAWRKIFFSSASLASQAR